MIKVLSRLASDSPFFFKGDVWWLDRTSAFQQNLAYINENNRAVLKVDNVSNVPYNEKRNTVFHDFSPPPRVDFDLISDPNYFSRLLRRWQPLDYRLDPSSIRVLGTYPSSVRFRGLITINYRMNAGVASILDQRADVAGRWRD